MGRTRLCGSMGVGLLLVSAAGSWAASFSWTFQRVDTAQSLSKQVALGMRTGATWPTVFYDGPPSIMVASSLTPAGWSPANLQAQSGPPYMRTVAGDDGRIGVAWQRGNEIRFAQSSALGWQSASVATLTVGPNMETAPDVAYLSGHRPVVAYSDGGLMRVMAYDDLVWTADTITAPAAGNSVSVATDTQDRIGVAYNGGGGVLFSFKDPALGSWITPVLPIRNGTANNLSLAFGPNDEAGIAMVSGGMLEFAWFDTQAGYWKRDLLASNISSTRVNLEFNSKGHPALSYVAGNEVHYRVNDGNGWADAVLPIGNDPDSALDVTPVPNSDAALAFDGEDLPVIAFNAVSGLVLAYDPIIPEPSSCLLILVGLGALIGRRNRR